MASKPIVLVEWRKRNEPTHNAPAQFLWHHMVLSLLYDGVLGQDEAFVYGRKFANWFDDDDKFDLLRELFDCGGLTVLKRPIESYPTPELQALAHTNSITARRELFRMRRVTYKGIPIRFSRKQIAFHSRLEALINNAQNSHAHQFGQITPDLMPRFSNLFFDVLTERKFRPWLKRKFPHITDAHAEEFAKFARDPDKAAQRLRDTKNEYADRVATTNPYFTPALAIQVAASYEPSVARSLQTLTESVFAQPFCQDEKAAGRYGRAVGSVPEDSGLKYGDARPVIADFKLSKIGLPLPHKGFGEVINRVRDGKSVQDLRNAMQNLGKDRYNLEYAAAKWVALADDIASAMHSPPRIWLDLVGVAAEFNEELFYSFAVEDTFGTHGGFERILLGTAAPILGASAKTFKIVTDYTKSTVQAVREQEQTSDVLAAAGQFYVHKHPE